MATRHGLLEEGALGAGCTRLLKAFEYNLSGLGPDHLCDRSCCDRRLCASDVAHPFHVDAVGHARADEEGEFAFDGCSRGQGRVAVGIAEGR